MEKDLLQVLQSKRGELSKSQKRIADFVLANYDRVSYMTAAKLARAAEVSESTVVRFAMELGFEKYPDFIRCLKEVARRKLTPNQRIRLANEHISDSRLIESVLCSDIERIKFTLEHVHREDFYRAAQMICRADAVYILGVRSSSALATFLGYYLELFFANVKLITSAGGSQLPEQMIHVSERDTVIAISYPRYAKSISNAAAYAKEKNARLVAVTDSADSPIGRLADVKLLAQSDMVSFADSLVAPLSVLNALVAVIGNMREETVSHSFELLEQMWDEYDVYDDIHN